KGVVHGRQISARRSPGAAWQGAAGVYAVSEPPWKGLEPRGRVENSFGVRAASGIAGSADASHAAPQFCHAPSRTRSGSAFRATHAGTCGHFYHADLYACGGRAVETDLH